MNLLDIAIKIFTWLIVLLFGFFLISLCFKSADTIAMLEGNSKFLFTRIAFGMAGIALVVMQVFWVLMKLRGSDRERELSFVTDQGEVEVSVSSLEASIKRVIAEVDDVESVSLRLAVPTARKRAVVCHIRTQIQSGAVIPEKLATIQRVAKERFQELLKGIDREVKTKVHVRLIDSDSITRDDMNKKRTSGRFFSGPEYPVDESNSD